MRVLAYKIFNQRKANTVIEVLLADGSKCHVTYTKGQYGHFSAACTILMNADVVLYDSSIERFRCQGSKSEEKGRVSEAIARFLNYGKDENEVS